jgi:hypothetical protein
MADFQEYAMIEGVLIKAATEKAILCIIDGKEVWIPQSQVDDRSEIWKQGDEGTLMISEWIARQKGIG